MKIILAKPFKDDFRKLPKNVQRRTERVLQLLVDNSRHPSLYTKKMEGVNNIWETRVTYHYRLTFQVSTEVLILRRVGTHDILRKP